jgi:hypothetical protein
MARSLLPSAWFGVEVERGTGVAVASCFSEAAAVGWGGVIVSAVTGDDGWQAVNIKITRRSGNKFIFFK